MYQYLFSVYKEKETEVREQLEENVNAIFKEIYNGGFSLKLDDKYNIQIQVDDFEGYSGDVETSTAQSISVIFAFIAGVIKMARENNSDENSMLMTEAYPLVMDAPLSAFDKTRIKTVSLLDDVNPVDIYKALEKFVQNKSLFKDFVESGGFRFEYIWYRMLIKDSVWEDGITSIIAVYRDTKNKNSQAAIDWLCKCIQEFDSAGEKWNLKARDMVENDNGRMDIELNKTMEFIGGVIEGVIKTYICFVNGCFSIQNGKVADTTIDLGVMTHNIIDKE